MTKASTGNWIPGPPGDVLNIGLAVRSGSTESLLTRGLQRARVGLLSVNGLNDFDANLAADFCAQLLVGFNIIAADCENQCSIQQLAELEAKTPPVAMAKARRMAKSYQSALADAEQSLTAPVQLELDFNPPRELPLTLD